MTIRLIKPVPVLSEHGLRKGRVLETIAVPAGEPDDDGSVWVWGDGGRAVKVISSEWREEL